jgi:hypothetical protein
MKHDPNDPAVKASYDAMIKETRDQYRYISAPTILSCYSCRTSPAKTLMRHLRN